MLAPLNKQLAKASGSKKGALTKHINRVLDGLLDKKAKTHEDDVELVAGIDEKQLEKARGLGKGLLREALETAEPSATTTRCASSSSDLCLRTDGKIQKEDFDALVQWLVKVREMYQDIESRRADTREAAVDSVSRLEETWNLFRELEPKQIVNDEQLFRELKDRFGSPYGFGVYFAGRHGRGGDPRAAEGSRPQGRGDAPPRDDQDVEGPEAAARDQAAEGRQRVRHLGEQA